MKKIFSEENVERADEDHLERGNEENFEQPRSGHHVQKVVLPTSM